VTLDPVDPPTAGVRRRARRVLILQGVALALLVGVILVGISPAPYVVERPGPAYDTLGTTSVDGEVVPVIEVEGAATYPTRGRLDLLTVYLDGSREHPLDWFSVLAGWVNPDRDVWPVDAIFPAGQTQEESDEQSAAAMQGSQQTAVAAALTELGTEFGAVVEVVDVPEATPASGVLEPGDELVAVDGRPIRSDGELRAAITARGVGESLELTVRRAGVERSERVVPVARSATDASPMIGVLVTVRYDFPFDVTINLPDVGGPSAGMMFGLGIYDAITPGALTGGEHIAGTGTIDADGVVGPIGGIAQKMVGARDAGAEWFLAPSENCDEVRGRVPAGLRVFAVSSFDQAVDVVTTIGRGDPTDGFPGCG